MVAWHHSEIDVLQSDNRRLRREDTADVAQLDDGRECARRLRSVSRIGDNQRIRHPLPAETVVEVVVRSRRFLRCPRLRRTIR